MERVSISRLKASLSSYLKLIKKGEDVVILERGRPIARIVPIIAEDGQLPPGLMALEQAGLAHLGTGHLPDTFWNLARIADPGGAARSALEEERDQGR